jgi:hypothetical protein
MIRLLDDGSIAVVVWNGGELLPQIARDANYDPPLPDTDRVRMPAIREKNRRGAYRTRERRKIFRAIQQRAARNHARSGVS